MYASAWTYTGQLKATLKNAIFEEVVVPEKTEMTAANIHQVANKIVNLMFPR